jgi:hypothetical protein
MFGNRLGWGISFIILICAAWLGYAIWQAGQVSAPTGWVPATVQPIQPPRGADTVVPEMNDPRDAGDLYRSAIEDEQANVAEYAAIESADVLDPTAIAARPGLAKLRDATRCSTMTLFRQNPQEIVTYDPDKPPLEAIEHLAKAAERIALLSINNKDETSAGWWYASVFSFGLKLYEERTCYAELTSGEELMGIGAVGLQRLALRQKLPAIAQSLGQFDTDRLADFDTHIAPVWAVVGSIDAPTMAAHAGDIILLARDRTADHLWRVEATFQLGKMKYGAGRRADQLAAQRILTEMANDSTEDSAVRCAAAAGRDLAIEQYRMLR